MTDVLTHMATWASELTWDDIPPQVRERAQDALRDTIATTVGGTGTTAARIALDFAATGVGDAPLSGRGRTTAPALAAFGNAVAASALDFDDGHYLAGAIHPGSVVVPAVLAVATPATTVRDAVVALVVGYEIGLRAAHLLWPKHDDDHYHATGCAGAIGAAAAAGKLLALDAEGIERAVKIGWVHAPMSTFGLPMVKESIGWGAMTGVGAAQLAAAGFMKTPPGYTIPPNDVLAPTPFHQRGAADDPFVAGIGQRWEVLGTYFKSFAACRYTHAAGAGLQRLMSEHGLTAADIRSIRVGTHRAATFLGEVEPRTIETAQYSFPFVLASIALWGAAGAAEISDEARLTDPERLRFAARIRLEHDADLDQYYPRRYPSRVEIETESGTVSGVFLDAPGDPGTSFGPEELRGKWRTLLAMGPGEPDAIIDGLGDPEAKLLDVLRPVWEAWS